MKLQSQSNLGVEFISFCSTPTILIRILYMFLATHYWANDPIIILVIHTMVIMAFDVGIPKGAIYIAYMSCRGNVADRGDRHRVV